ncbi:adenosylcobinamide-phosphate synthase CbiB [Oceanobacillus sp. CAU 1775]
MYNKSTEKNEDKEMIFNHIIAIILAYIIDLIIGDPKNWPHPVKWMGTFIAFLDKRLNKGRHKKIKGLIMVLLLLIITFSLSALLVFYIYKWHQLAGILLEGILIATTIAQNDLKKAALEVVTPLKKRDLREARIKLSYIVGRDTAELSEQEIVRGTVETVAENTTDGVTSPLFWAVIGGAPFAFMYRAVNTSDSMVGYKNEKYKDFGWASARLDDILNWIPARVTGVITMLAIKPKGHNYREAWQILIRDAKKHNSPNSGWGEASVAAVLGIQLGGINYYKGEKSLAPLMGESKFSLQTIHILEAIRIMQRTVFLFLVMLSIGGVLYELARTWF